MQQKRVLILGVNGFIGHHLTRRILETTPWEVYVNRRGVCQDFANLLICMARVLGIPARYRVGYIFAAGRDATARRGAAEASHAWAELYLPHDGWRGFDPTNGCLVGRDHVRVACGRNFRDAAPTSGPIYRGGGRERNGRSRHPRRGHGHRQRGYDLRRARLPLRAGRTGSTTRAGGRRIANRPGDPGGRSHHCRRDPSAPMFAQNDTRWAKTEYAKASDEAFRSQNTCGSTIAQCGCAMTSVTTTKLVNRTKPREFHRMRLWMRSTEPITLSKAIRKVTGNSEPTIQMRMQTGLN